MRTAAMLAVAILAVIMLAGGCGSTAPAPGERPLRLLALGDSYTIGEGVGEHERWPSLVAERLRTAGVDVAPPTVVARTGWTTDELAAAIAGAPLDPPYDAVTLMIGVNDQYRGRGVERFLGGFRGLLDTAVAMAGGDPGRVVVVSIPDWGVTPFAADRDRRAIAEEIDAFDRAARREAAARGAAWVDVTGISREMGGAPEAVAADGLHPSPEQHRRWAAMIAPAVREALPVR